MLHGRASTDASRGEASGDLSDATDDRDGDTGSAALEFIIVGLVLLVPIVYLIIALGAIQGQALGVETGARQLARTIAEAPDTATADARAERVLRAITAEYGIDPAAVEVRIDCRGSGTTCPEAGEVLVVTVSTRVPLPLVPPVLGLDEAARVSVESTSVQKVSRFWGTEP